MKFQYANRLSDVKEYYFSEKLKELRELKAQGRNVINLGIGSPDRDPDPSVVKQLVDEVYRSGVSGYQPYQGIPELEEAIRSFYEKHYQLSFTDRMAFLPLMGSKEGITHLSLAYLNPGDQVLVPSLGYPTYTSVTRMVEAGPIYYPLQEDRNWDPDWNYLDELDTSRVRLIWINYPHMPTGARGSKALLERFVSYARERNVLLCHDNPYSFILNDRPLSIFSIKGAEEVSVEFNSLSKTFNMAGWRVGWAIGDRDIINPVLRIKSNMDSGMFRPVQVAAVQALRLQDEWLVNLNREYAARRQIVFKVLSKLGCTFSKDQAGMFVWAKVPGVPGRIFSDRLLEQHDVFVAPGFIFGSGEQYIRISLCTSIAILEEVYHRLS